MMKSTMHSTLRTLADKYENPGFCDDDPSQFLRRYEKVPGAQVADTEAASFIAAMLAFGSRTQFIPKINFILDIADKTSGTISQWLVSGSCKKDFPTGAKKFYRFYSYDDMHTFFGELAKILEEAGSLGSWCKAKYEEEDAATATAALDQLLSAAFPQSRIVPKGRTSANKRLHMFLRWMVRQNSPVDLGLWSWYPQSRLLLPLDVHVMQEAIKLGLLPPDATPSRKTAVTLTARMQEFFPGDPSRADYALFGLGVDK